MTFFLVVLNTFLTGYRAMLQPVFFDAEDDEHPTGRYERSSLTAEDAKRHEARLLALMEHECPSLMRTSRCPRLPERSPCTRRTCLA